MESRFLLVSLRSWGLLTAEPGIALAGFQPRRRSCGAASEAGSKGCSAGDTWWHKAENRSSAGMQPGPAGAACPGPLSCFCSPPSAAAATSPPAAALATTGNLLPSLILPIFVQKNNPTALFQARGAGEGNHPCEEFVCSVPADLPGAAIPLQRVWHQTRRGERHRHVLFG